MIINIISDIKKIVLEIVLFILVLTGILYAMLIKGIEVDHITLGPMKFEKLYLKLDKKLILRAKKIALPLKGSSSTRLPNEIVYLRYIPRLFQRIELANLSFKSTSLSLLYKGGLFYLKTKDIDAVAKLYNIQKKLFFDLKHLRYIPWNLTIKGSGKIVADSLSMSGKYDFEKIKGAFLLRQKAKKIHLTMNSKTFGNKELARAFSHLPVHPEIKAWSYKKIKARLYRLERLEMEGAIDRLSTKDVKASAVGERVDVKFHPKLPPAHIKKVRLTLKNDNLSFKLTHPVYENKKLDGSWVKIHSLSHNSYIDIFLKLATPFDPTVKRTIEAFGVKIPLLQKEGLTRGDLLITIDLRTLATKLLGIFHAQNSLFDLAGVDLYSEDLSVKLSDGRIIIRHSPIALPSLTKALCDGYYDIKKKRGKFQLKDLNVTIEKEGIELFELQDFSDTLTIDANAKKLRLLKLNTIYDFDRHLLEVEHLEDFKSKSPILSKLDPLRANLRYNIENGDVHAMLLLQNSPLRFHGKTLKKFIVTGNIKKKIFHINNIIDVSLSRRIELALRDLDIMIKDSGEGPKLQKPLFVKFQNVSLLYDSHRLIVPKGYLRYNKERYFLYDQLPQGKIVIKKDANLSIEAKSITSRILGALLGKHIFDKGLYDLRAFGSKKELYGTLLIKEGYIKDLKALNNFFAFINTIPALVTLSNPGFDTEGLPIHRGRIDFLYKENLLVFKRIDLRSDALNIKGEGVVDLKKKRIDMLLHLQTFKKVSSIIKHIPIAGYIVLGKDGTISTAVQVSGTLDDPKFSSKLPQETIKLPFKIIKRTLELPFKLFE